MKTILIPGVYSCLIAIERDYNLTLGDNYSSMGDNKLAVKHYCKAAEMQQRLLLNDKLFEIDRIIDNAFLN